MSTAPTVDFSRYFAIRQRAYLINISEERDREQYESLSGVIVSCLGNAIAVQIPYTTGQESPVDGTRRTTYKLTSESMGDGIQIMADLEKVTENNVFHLQLHGSLEMYQRRHSPRINTTLKLFQIRRDTSLAIYRKEFKRITDSMHIQGARPKITLLETPINLSAGGLRIALAASEPVPPIAMFFLELDPAQPLVCAVAELIWKRHEQEQLICGYRFVQIRKTDQERIGQFVDSLQKEQGIATSTAKIYWELLDRMTSERPGS